jgi:hypothetical protein
MSHPVGLDWIYFRKLEFKKTNTQPLQNLAIMIKIRFMLLFAFCSSYCSAQWQQCAGTAGLNMQSLLTDDGYDFAGGATGAYRSSDTAASYSFFNNGNSGTGPTRAFTKDSVYIYTCTNTGVYRSGDHGTTWISSSSGLTNLLSSGVLAASSHLFLVGPTGVSRSDDQGDNWSAAGMAGIDVRSICAIQDTLFVGTNGSGIYKSTDWGVSWTAINNGLGSAANFRAIESKGTTIFAGGPIGTGVFRSTDFGVTWTLLTGGLPSGSYRGFGSNSQLIVAGSFGAGVSYSLDNGDTWTVINNGLTDSTIFDIEINDHYIVAATNSAGVFRFPLSALNIPTGMTDPMHINETICFPNPTTGLLQIRAVDGLPDAAYEVVGLEGKTLLKGDLHEKTTVLDLSGWSAGTYFLRTEEGCIRLVKY